MAKIFPLVSEGVSCWQCLSLDELEREYSPSSVASDFRTTLATYHHESERVLQKFHPTIELAYGDLDSQKITLFQASHDNCLLVWFHGGYWQELSRQESLFPVQGFVPNGISYAAVGYTLAPHASLTQIVQECVNALLYLQHWYQAQGKKPHIIIAGSSAGAHLAATLLTYPWAAIQCTAPFHGAILLSGIYDLSPLVKTYINHRVGLTMTMAHQLSPLFRKDLVFLPVRIFWGEKETQEFKRQSRAFAHRLFKSAVPDIQAHEIALRDHFDLVFDVGNLSTFVGSEIVNMFARLSKPLHNSFTT